MPGRNNRRRKSQYSRALSWFSLLGIAVLLCSCSNDKGAAYVPIERAVYQIPGGYSVHFLERTEPKLKDVKFHHRFLGTLCRYPREASTKGLSKIWAFEFKDGEEKGIKPKGVRKGYAIINRTDLFRVSEWSTDDQPLNASEIRTAERDVLNRFGCTNNWTP